MSHPASAASPIKKILVVDDHPLFREGLKSITDNSGRYSVIAEAGSASEALQAALEHRPDLAIVDIGLPDHDGITLARQLLDASLDIHILIVSMTTRADQIAAAFQVGATGYLNKGSASGELLTALDATQKGQFYLDTNVSHEIAADFFTHKRIVSESSYTTELTAREQEVMKLLAEDLSTKEVAERLFISPRTVENHRSNLMRKLGLKTTIDFVKYAFKQGLIDLKE